MHSLRRRSTRESTSKTHRIATRTISKAIANIAQEPLGIALSNLADGSGLAFSSYERTIPEYLDISSSLGGEEQRFGLACDVSYGKTTGDKEINQACSFTDIFDLNRTETTTPKKIKTKVSYALQTCMCRNFECTETAAIDLIGITRENNPLNYSPILLLDERGATVPCLDHLPMVPMEHLELRGCSNHTRFPKKRDCGSDEVENFIFVDKRSGLAFGRTLSNKEMFPEANSSIFDPSLAMADFLEQPSIQLPPSKVAVNITLDLDRDEVLTRWTQDLPEPFAFKLDPIPPVHMTIGASDISPLLNDFSQELLKAGVDAFGYLGVSADGGETPSNTPVHKFVRYSDALSAYRLWRSMKHTAKATMHTISASPPHMSIVNSRPESSPIQECISGVATLLIVSCAFGTVIGSLWRKNAFQTMFAHFFTPQGLSIALYLLAGFVVELLEVSAYAFRWSAEKEQNSFKEAMVHVSVTSSDQGLPIFEGKNGRFFVAATYVVEVSDASSDLSWLFITGAVLSIIAFCLSVFIGPTLKQEKEKDHILDDADQKCKGGFPGGTIALASRDRWLQTVCL